MTSAIKGRSDQAPRRMRRWGLISLVTTGILTLLIAACLALWSETTSSAHVAGVVARFAAVMMIVRPIILLTALMLWRPVFSWLHRRSFVTDQTHTKALTVWPRLMVWTGLIELTLGQGYVLTGIGATAAYWLFLRLR